MDKIKEKPKVTSPVREKVKAAPKELARRTLTDGSERLRTQLRDTAQHGQRDEYGGDRIEDTAAGSVRRMERGAAKLIKERKRGKGAASPDAEGSSPYTEPPEIRTKEREAATAVDDPYAAAVVRDGETPVKGIKTKDAYLREQTGTQITGLQPEHTQGEQAFIQERGRQAAKQSAQKSAEIRKERARHDVIKDADAGAVHGRQGMKTPPLDRTGSSVQGREGAAPARTREPASRAPTRPVDTQTASAPVVKAAGRNKTVFRAKPAAQVPRQAVKTADRAGHASAATAHAASQTAQSAKAMRAAQRTARTKQAAKSAGSAVKKAAGNAGKALRAIYAAARSLMAAAIAGGSVVLSLLILICLFGLLVASPFGILFTSEPTDEGTVALSTAIAQINMEYTEQLEELQNGDYDQITINGAAPDWREVVAVFAVKTAGTNDGVDVVTLDADRVERLRTVFWDMVSLSSEIETIEHGDSDPDDDVDDSWTETILTITVTGKTLDEMREFYSFTDEQNNMLDELLDNLELIGGAIGNLGVTDIEAQELLDALPNDLSAERRAIIETACQLVGKVNYFWGGKSLTIGWDSRWGTTMQVTSAGSSTTGTYRPFGLDCSGYVDWVFHNASGGTYTVGRGGGAASQHAYCTEVAWEDALPGDLVFYADDSHVGIVGGWDSSGNLLVIHCSSSYNNVVITGADGFTSVARPDYYD